MLKYVVYVLHVTSFSFCVYVYVLVFCFTDITSFIIKLRVKTPHSILQANQ